MNLCNTKEIIGCVCVCVAQVLIPIVAIQRSTCSSAHPIRFLFATPWHRLTPVSQCQSWKMHIQLKIDKFVNFQQPHNLWGIFRNVDIASFCFCSRSAAAFFPTYILYSGERRNLSDLKSLVEKRINRMIEMLISFTCAHCVYFFLSHSYNWINSFVLDSITMIKLLLNVQLNITLIGQ